MTQYKNSNSAIEDRNYSKNRVNVKKLIVFFITIYVSMGMWGQTFEFECRGKYNAKIKFDLTNEKVIFNSQAEKIDVWRTDKVLDKNYKTVIIFLHTNKQTYCFMDTIFTFTSESGDAINDPTEWSYLESEIYSSKNLIGYNFNQIVKAIDTKGQYLFDQLLDDMKDSDVKTTIGRMDILADNYQNPEAMNRNANMNMNMVKNRNFRETNGAEMVEGLIKQAMRLYEKAMKMGNENAKKNYNFYMEALKKDKNITSIPPQTNSTTTTSITPKATATTTSTTTTPNTATTTVPLPKELVSFKRHVDIPQSKMQTIVNKSNNTKYERKESGEMLNKEFIVPYDCSFVGDFYGMWISEWEPEKYKMSKSIEFGFNGYGSGATVAIKYLYDNIVGYSVYTRHGDENTSHVIQCEYTINGNINAYWDSNDKDWLQDKEKFKVINSVYSFKEITIEDGVYAGELKYGKPDGYGILKFPDGSLWFGEWKNGIKNGYGALYSKDFFVTKTGKWLDSKVSD